MGKNVYYRRNMSCSISMKALSVSMNQFCFTYFQSIAYYFVWKLRQFKPNPTTAFLHIYI